MVIYTIGYEGARLEDFVATLLTASIDTLIDVRERPISRKAGFSKYSLEQAINSAGISYLHLQALGDPKEGREAARRGDYETFRRIFFDHLASNEAQQALEEVKNRAAYSRICLMCYEKDPDNCHRGIIADALRNQTDVAVQHLGVQRGASGKTVITENEFA